MNLQLQPVFNIHKSNSKNEVVNMLDVFLFLIFPEPLYHLLYMQGKNDPKLPNFGLLQIVFEVSEKNTYSHGSSTPFRGAGGG